MCLHTRHVLAVGFARSSTAVVAQPPHVFAKVIVTCKQTDRQAGCTQGEQTERERHGYRQADRVRLKRHEPAQSNRQTSRRL